MKEDNNLIVEYLRILEKGLEVKGFPDSAIIARDARIEIEKLRLARDKQARIVAKERLY